MKSRIIEFAIFSALAALLLTAVYLIRPINERAAVRQTEGTDFSQSYLGRTILVQTGQTLRQSFTAPGSGSISAVGVFTPEPNRDAIGSLLFKLLKVNANKEVALHSSTDNISVLANNEGLSIWRFPPVETRKGDRFVISLTAKATPGFLAFIANRDAYQGGSAAVGNKKLGVDIAFQVFYGLTGPDLWRHLSGSAPNLLKPGALLALIIIFWLALAAWLQQLWLISVALTRDADGTGTSL